MDMGQNTPIGVFARAFALYAAVLMVVVAGAWSARPAAVGSLSDEVFDVAFQWDGKWYAEIAEHGYSYDKSQMSSVAFSPVYPLIARFAARLFGCSTRLGLLITSNVSLVAAFYLFIRYLRHRFPDDTASQGAAVWVFGMFPVMFFVPMAYSESVFMCLVLLVLAGLLEDWPILVTAVICGVATAARPVGVALVVPVIAKAIRSNQRSRPLRLLAIGAICTSGISFFALFQWIQFGDPFAFVQTQSHWRLRPELPLLEHAKRLISLEPIWSVYSNEWPMGWHYMDNRCSCAFASLQAGNPVLFIGAVVTVFIGWSNRWFFDFEFQIAFGMMLITYVTRSYEMCMASQGRFLLPIFPLFIVLGRMVAKLPPLLRPLPVLTGGVFLFVYSRMWAIGNYLI